MNIIERPIVEVASYQQARKAIREIILGELSWMTAENRLFSGFDSDCIVDGNYEPTAEHVTGDVLYAATAYDWYYKQHAGLADVGHYAARHKRPAVGVYDLEKFDPVRALQWKTKNGLTVPETCTDIFVWR